MTIYGIYDEVAYLIATLDPAKVAALKAPEAVQQRFDLLAEKSKEQAISRAEKDELDHYVVLERLIRLAKIRAQFRPTL